MGKRQGPKTEVRRRVGDTVQTELDSVDRLVNHDLGKIKLNKRNVSALGPQTCMWFSFLSSYLFLLFVFLISARDDGLAVLLFVVRHVLILSHGLVLVLAVLLLEVVRLGEPHPGHTHEGDQKQDSLQGTLARVQLVFRVHRAG